MNAVISGTAGRALLIDGDSLKSFDIDEPSNLVVRQQGELPYLFGEGRNLRIIEASDLESITKELKAESDLSLALDLTLISLDEELEEDIRRDAIKELDELLVDAQLRERLEGIMYARPLPDDGDLVGALKFCNNSRFPNSLVLFQDLERRQPLISKVNAAWDVVPTNVFGSYEQQVEFERVAVQRGLFRVLILTLENLQSVSNFLLRAGLDLSVNHLHNYRQVLQNWASPFRETDKSRIIQVEREPELELEALPRRRHGRRIGLNARAALTEVNRQKAIISGAIHSRDLATVRNLLEDLIEYQLVAGNAERLAMSLCSLAMEAKELSMYSLQLELTERSIIVAPADNWSWIQHGDALLNNNRLDEALQAYRQAQAFGASLIAKAGEAEVLKSQGRFAEALIVFENLIADNPDAIIAYNGRADALRALGKLQDALATYDYVILTHPHDLVARNGRAEVLRLLGLFDEALLAYDEIIAEYPQNIIAKHGREDLLRKKEELYGSLVAHNEMMKQDPEDTAVENNREAILSAIRQLNNAQFAYSGRSSVLAAKGRYSEAFRYLPKKSPVTPQDWHGYHIRGLILLLIGQVTEAGRIFNEGSQGNPSPANREHFRSALAMERLQKHDFKRASWILKEISSPSVQTEANILRIHVFGALGDTKSAARAYESLAPSSTSISKELADELHRRYILGQDPIHDEDWLLEHEIQLLLASA